MSAPQSSPGDVRSLRNFLANARRRGWVTP